ncbi:Protein of unknown function (DUF423) [Leishmania donovani]|uniref:Protein_of_uncharacterized_function_(DUF423)_-_pu tative n=3 Tax=Leishmania donovani species complex TaxID=38574 RepID=A0A6L0XIM1_LEIIN|nr:conserved hypothetical protein [Leishmania infantum JPCM5]XP_003862262.1 hypothetical protein, conserved [Leishmania donovani]CAC9503552.1 Protein_of_uncharacterised_function_(DUF423)_-_putative [Leishmania infantum]AYU80314.1 Protein of unknown function (DUF423), putative [Leishmania donovani]TPP40482.1 hypothetical protein CGC20_13335 [Leishmania donovani]TPP54292.1 hypothetical protein CGC21_22255 [Leishmania donovani]CAJ1990303.1 Protein of unknown function (DUF423) [Leishmania donovan|eukprot:XP_001470191.1 conserved hypothetical protein [Leishmania infantum JPCM5]
MVSIPLLYSGVLGFTGVVAGAVGSHALKAKSAEERNAFVISSQYQLMHSIAALGAIGLSQAVRSWNPVAAKRLRIAAWMFLLGTTLFSGTVYARVFGAPKSVGQLAPTGGYILMGGWACLIAAAVAL